MTSSKDKDNDGGKDTPIKGTTHTTNQPPLFKEKAPKVSFGTPTQGKVQLKNLMTLSKDKAIRQGYPIKKQGT